MRRRQFIKAATAMAGLGLADVSPLFAAVRNGGAAPRRVAVIGAGIIGASIAWNLSRRGCDVTVFEKRAPATQASGNSFAWFNASYVKMPYSYHLLSNYSVQEYPRLAATVDFPLRQGGSLEWSDDPAMQREIAEGIATVRNFGAPAWQIDRGAAEDLEPAVNFGDSDTFAFSELDGAVNPKATTLALLAAAGQNGALLRFPVEVRHVTTARGTVTIATNDGDFAFDRVVVAAGMDSSEIAAGLDITLAQRPSPGFIVTTKPLPLLLNTVLVAPGVHMHQRSDGRVILGEQGGPPDTGAHAAYLRDRPNSYPAHDIALQHAARLLLVAKRYLPALADAEVEQVGIGWRPMPMDGLPVVGRTKAQPGVHFAVMHSGVTLAPIVGRLTALEILDDIEVNLLADFRLERFEQRPPARPSPR